MKYAAAHPDRFTAAYAFSPAVDLNDPPVIALASASGLSDGSRTPGAIFGLRATEEVRWRNENGNDLAVNLRPLQLGLLTGNGQPGGAGRRRRRPTRSRRASTGRRRRCTPRLDAAGHPPPVRRLRRRRAPVVLLAARPPAGPAAADGPLRPPARGARRRSTYTRADPDYSVFGWKVHVERPALEFSTLRGATRRGFTLEGSGTGTVRTPRFYTPGRTFRVTLTGGRR